MSRNQSHLPYFLSFSGQLFRHSHAETWTPKKYIHERFVNSIYIIYC